MHQIHAMGIELSYLWSRAALHVWFFFQRLCIRIYAADTWLLPLISLWTLVSLHLLLNSLPAVNKAPTDIVSFPCYHYFCVAAQKQNRLGRLYRLQRSSLWVTPSECMLLLSSLSLGLLQCIHPIPCPPKVHCTQNLFSPFDKIGSFTFCLAIMDCLCIQAGMHLCWNFCMYPRSQPMWNKAARNHNVHDTIIQTRIPVCKTCQFPLMTLLVHGILCTCTPFCMNV